MRTPMPSPTGFNREQLFLPRSFPRAPLGAYDEAPEAPASQRAMLRRKARRFFENTWQAQWEDFCEATGLGLEDERAEDESVTEPQHRAISAAASMRPATEDELPGYGPNGIPRPSTSGAMKRPSTSAQGAMDVREHPDLAGLRQAMAHIKIGTP